VEAGSLRVLLRVPVLALLMKTNEDRDR
jgi:hypothetical protein